MAPHLVTAQCAYKDIRICSFLHTHAHTHSTNTHTLSLSLSLTHILQIHALLVMGWENEKKEDDRSQRRREEVCFQF